MGSKIKNAGIGGTLGSIVMGPAGAVAGAIKGGSSGGIGKDIKGPFNSLMQGLGLKQQEEAFGSDLNSVQAMLSAAANDPEGVATQQFRRNSNEGLGKVLSAIASQKNLQASEQANMAARTNRDMQQDVASQAGLMGLEEQAQNRQLLAQFLLNRSGAKQALNTNTIQRITDFAGKLASSAGSMGGGGAGAAGASRSPAVVG